MNTIVFPHLGNLTFNISPTAFSLFGHEIAWYGIIIATAMLLALLYGFWRCKSFKVSVDDLSDVVIFAIIFGIIGARLYFVLFSKDETGGNPYFADPVSIFYIWNGGLGFYGGAIAAFITAFVVCKIKKINIWDIFDIGALGFLIGQCIGRWGNFVNGEAYGGDTNLPWGMLVNGHGPVHPCFLYESLWLLLGFIVLHIYSRHRKFSGEIFLMYVMWNTFGRFFIEGLRSDSLWLGMIKISQLVACVCFFGAGAVLIYMYTRHRKIAEEEAAVYNPLFEETSKAVKEETSKELSEYDVDEEDDPEVKEEAEEEAKEDKNGSKEDKEENN